MWTNQSNKSPYNHHSKSIHGDWPLYFCHSLSRSLLPTRKVGHCLAFKYSMHADQSCYKRLVLLTKPNWMHLKRTLEIKQLFQEKQMMQQWKELWECCFKKKISSLIKWSQLKSMTIELRNPLYPSFQTFLCPSLSFCDLHILSL